MAFYGSLMETREEIMEKFLLLDILCEHHDIEAEWLVLDMSDLKFRATRDIDVTFLSASNEEKLIELLDEVQMDLVKGIVDLPPLEIFMKMIICWLPINRRGLQPTQTVQKTRPL